MFFWYEIHQQKIRKKASLQTCHKEHIPKFSDSFLNPKNKKAKRTFSFSPFFTEASMCLESALSFSFFLIFFLNILSLILLFTSYTKQLEELHSEGKEKAIHSYLFNQLLPGEEVINLKNRIEVRSPFPLLGFDKGNLQVGCVVKPWTGYGGGMVAGGQETEEMVYKTENGSVYHKKRSCTHLSLSIQMLSYQDEIMKGRRYSPCEYCYAQGEEENQNQILAVYITNFGNRYHKSVSCQGLKRTVECVPVSQVEGMPQCSKCN